MSNRAPLAGAVVACCRLLVAPEKSRVQFVALRLVKTTPLSPTAVHRPAAKETRFKFVRAVLDCLAQLVPLELVAMKPAVPTAANKPLPQATPRRSLVRLAMPVLLC